MILAAEHTKQLLYILYINKGRTQGKLTTCEDEFAWLFLTLGFQHNCPYLEHVHPYEGLNGVNR